MRGRQCCGIYTAELAEKIDQYTKVDPGPTTSDPNVKALHDRLNRKGCTHPGSVYYAFVCRVSLGYYVSTKDGMTSLAHGEQLFPITKKELATIPHAANTTNSEKYHSLLAETGGQVQHHREFVIFHSDYTYPEYLVAYERA